MGNISPYYKGASSWLLSYTGYSNVVCDWAVNVVGFSHPVLSLLVLLIVNYLRAYFIHIKHTVAIFSCQFFSSFFPQCP